VVRIIVASPDDRLVLARPNGLAGWTLPAVPVPDPFPGWDEAAVAAAGDQVGAPVDPVGEVAPGYWVVRARGRVPANGRTWIPVAEAARLGADADAVRRWAGLGSGR
jgi:hypothetical protein